jgi:hypothetical protein
VPMALMYNDGITCLPWSAWLKVLGLAVTLAPCTGTTTNLQPRSTQGLGMA